MYVIPLLVVVLICLAIFLSPILAAEAAPAQSPGKHFTTDPDPAGERTGLWGERRPE